jgi:hypothetical protein
MSYSSRRLTVFLFALAVAAIAILGARTILASGGVHPANGQTTAAFMPGFRATLFFSLVVGAICGLIWWGVTFMGVGAFSLDRTPGKRWLWITLCSASTLLPALYAGIAYRDVIGGLTVLVLVPALLGGLTFYGASALFGAPGYRYTPPLSTRLS